MLELKSKGIDNQQNLIEQENQKTHKIFQNRLFLTSLLNGAIFLVYVFSMCYYDWGTVGVPLLQTSGQSFDPSLAYFHFNLLYAKMDNNPSYLSFTTVSTEICIKSDYFCVQMMTSIRFLGFLCFFLLLAGAGFQVYDIVRTIVYLLKKELQSERFSESKQDNLRHMVTIGLFLVGLTLDIFGMAYMDVYFRYGVSFYIFVAGLVGFIVVIVYQQFSMYKLQQQKMIMALIQGEKDVSRKINRNVDIQLSEGESYI